MTRDDGIRGLALFLGLTLMASGILKARSLTAFARSLSQLAPNLPWPSRGASRAVAILVVALEIVIGAGLLVMPADQVAGFGVAAGILCVGFAVAVTMAVRRGLSCGCFGELSRTPAGGAEIARTVALLSEAVALTVLACLRVGGPPAPLVSAGSMAFGAATGLATVLLTVVGGVVWRRARALDSGPSGARGHVARGLGVTTALVARGYRHPSRSADAVAWAPAALEADFAGPEFGARLVAVAREDPRVLVTAGSAALDWAAATAIRCVARGNNDVAFTAVVVPAGPHAIAWASGLTDAPTVTLLREHADDGQRGPAAAAGLALTVACSVCADITDQRACRLCVDARQSSQRVALTPQKGNRPSMSHSP